MDAHAPAANADTEPKRMADENPVSADLSSLRRLLDPEVRRIGFGAGPVLDAVARSVPISLDALVDPDPARQGTANAGCVVEPVEAIGREDPENTIVLLYALVPENPQAQVGALGPYATLHARSLLDLPELPAHGGATHAATVDASIADRAVAAIERRYLWRVLSIPRGVPFAIHGAGDLGRVVLALCRRLGREPVVFFENPVVRDAVEGVPVRRAQVGLDEFTPELVVDARSGPPRVPAPDGEEVAILRTLARCAWSDWREVCDELAREDYARPDSFERWNEGHRRLYRRFSMIPGLGLPEDSVASLTAIVRPERETPRVAVEPRDAPRRYARAIESQREGEPDGAVANFFRDKHVALVGPSEHLLEERMGATFDAADCVVRLNTTLEHLPIAKSLAPHMGSRTDVLYLSIGYANKLIAWRRAFLERLLGEVPLRAIVCLDTVLSVGVRGVEGVGPLAAFRELVESRRPDLAFGVETRTPRMIVPWLDGSAPRMGFGTIADLLAHRPRRLAVAGFTFYHGGGHLFRGEVAGALDPTLSNDGRICTHDSRRELECLRAFVAAPSLPIECDATLTRLLSPGAAERATPSSPSLVAGDTA